MAGRINHIFREYISIISIILTIIGAIALIVGALGTFSDMLTQSNMISEDMVPWSPYLLGIGLIILLTGVYYLYSYVTKKRFVLSELTTNKRSEFVKRHQEVRNAVKFLPKKYAQLLHEKEKELKIK